jgi:hypothetical protein
MAKLLDEYAAIAEWDVSTRQTNEGFVRRTIKPALGHLEVRKVPGPILDQLYARLKRCGDLSCTGRPFTSTATSRSWYSTRAAVGQPGSRSPRRSQRPSSPAVSPPAMSRPRSPN